MVRAGDVMADTTEEQRRRARRNAVILGIVAALFYLGFILATGLRGS